MFWCEKNAMSCYTAYNEEKQKKMYNNDVGESKRMIN